MGFKRRVRKRQNNRLRERSKSERNIMTKSNNLKSLDHFIDEKIGEKGTAKRDQFEHEYDAFKLGVLIQQARKQKGLTQEKLAELSGTNKSYISRLERDLKDIRFSTLQKIINQGLGGQLNISISFD